jgi:hypothetical protein
MHTLVIKNNLKIFFKKLHNYNHAKIIKYKPNTWTMKINLKKKETDKI